jgi:hypothetical protein
MNDRKIPRAIKDKDPRNIAHLTAAQRLIRKTATLAVTTTALAEVHTMLGPRASSVLQDMSVCPNIPGDAIVICMFFYLEDSLLVSDNFIGRCADCGAAVQFRPEVKASSATRLCIFCGADRCLASYWAEQSKGAARGKRLKASS